MKYEYIFLLLIFGAMATLAILSMRDDSAIMDEVAHLPAGYSYLTQRDYRLNPEHPPLIKDLSALPLLFQKINFPSQLKSWTDGINDQWSFGFDFMYRSGNDADKMLFWGRLPIFLLSLLLGLFLFIWARRLYGHLAGLIALFLYAFSPSIIAHSRFVTTDIAAAFGFFTAIYFFVQWLRQSAQDGLSARSDLRNKSDLGNILLAGLFLGIALLLKFSTFLLLPLFVFLTAVWLIINPIRDRDGSQRVSISNGVNKKYRLKTAFGLILIFIIGFAVIYPVYQYHVWNYPVAKQQNDIKTILVFNPLEKWGRVLEWMADKPVLKYAGFLADAIKNWGDTLAWMADKPVLRAYAQYLYGLSMVVGRAAGGNTTFFLGDVSNLAWKNYFPVIYAVKEPLALHILTIIVLFCLIFIKSPSPSARERVGVRAWFKEHFTEFSMLSFVALYWFSSITSNLNIGIRHVLPTFPFIYLLISGQLVRIKNIELRIKRLQKILILTAFGLLFVWYIIANLSIFPSYLAYFNELVGGADKGYLYAVDSNLDWGQDAKRLAIWADEQKIDKIYTDYFGGAAVEYYLKDKYILWHSDYGRPDGWLAVSATFYQTSKVNPKTSYTWLDNIKPVAKIGYSIFIYNFNNSQFPISNSQ